MGNQMGFFGKRFEELAEEFLSRQAIYSNDKRTTPSNVRILLRYFRGIPLREIRPKDIEDMIAARLKEVGRTTINRNRACLSKMMTSAIQWGYLAGPNPCVMVKKFKESPGRLRWLTRDEFDRLHNAASDHLKPILVMAVMTGGRLSEILLLRWLDIDLDAGVVHFRKENTKSQKERQVPLSDDVRRILETIRRPDYNHARVFLYNNRSITCVKTAFNRARRNAGLEDICFHTLRHTFASWYMQNGGDLYRLRNLMGHSTIALTERYSHLGPDFIKSAVQFFGPPKTGVGVKTSDDADLGYAASINGSGGDYDLS